MKIEWEEIEQDRVDVPGKGTVPTHIRGIKCDIHAYRAKILGGWLVLVVNDVWDKGEVWGPNGAYSYQWRSSICFVPDADHRWDA